VPVRQEPVPGWRLQQEREPERPELQELRVPASWLRPVQVLLSFHRK
jgi:hypothetical protein